MKRRRGVDIFNLSFLDVVSCGFGAIILLLVISKLAEPRVQQQEARDLEVRLQRLEQETGEIRSRSRDLRTELAAISRAVEELEGLEEAAAGNLQAEEDELAALEVEVRALEKIRDRMDAARQDLSEEMRRLEAVRTEPPPDAVVGGVPVDSEYIIFVIDTSGSMQKFAWPLVRSKMAEILDVYPEVKGIQVLNDMGEYMFSQYSGRWIPDSPSRRRAILRRLASWAPFSNSSPAEGVQAAISGFYRPGRRISVYVFGDDFSRGSIQEVVSAVDRVNRGRGPTDRLVRIHGIGFPVLFTQSAAGDNLDRFAALMRRLAEDNNGSFVGLTSLR